jgi:hypothetical protein
MFGTHYKLRCFPAVEQGGADRGNGCSTPKLSNFQNGGRLTAKGAVAYDKQIKHLLPQGYVGIDGRNDCRIIWGLGRRPVFLHSLLRATWPPAGAQLFHRRSDNDLSGFVINVKAEIGNGVCPGHCLHLVIFRASHSKAP